MREWLNFDEDSRNDVVEIDYSCNCGEGYDEPVEGWDRFLVDESNSLAATLRAKFPNATISVDLSYGESESYEIYGTLANGRTVLIVNDPFEAILDW